MKQTAVEWLFKNIWTNPPENLLEILDKAKEMEEKLQLELVHKFVFDYTYNYRGNKTLYEYVDGWYEEYKRLEQLNK